MKAAAQVGLLVVIAVALFLAGVFVIGKAFPGTKRDVYLVAMPDAGGLANGARVLMAGVQVGEVTKVGLASPTEARLEISLKHGTELPLSTRALIAGSLVGLGDTPLNLVQDALYRGPAGDFDPGMTIVGGKAGPLDAILPDGGTKLYSQLNETLGAVRTLLQDKSLQKDVHATIQTAQATLRSSGDTLRAFTQIATRADGLLAQNQDEIAHILRTVETTLTSVQGTAESIERFAKGNRLQNGATELLADAHRIALESQATLVDLHRTLNDPKLNGDLRASADNLKATSDRLPALVDNANRVAGNVADLTAKSQDLPKKLGDAIDGATDLEKRLGGLTDKFGGVLGKKSKGVPPITTELDLVRETEPGYYRTDLRLSLPLGDGFATAGLWDAFGRNRLILQLGTNVGSKFDYRYGVYAGRPGIGVDYAFTPKLGFRGDLWDINDPRLDARLRYEFGGGLIGWLGMDRIFQNSAVTIGLGIRR